MLNRNRIISIATKVFLIGLLVQFFAHTFVTFGLGRDHSGWGLLRAWKEIRIAVALAIIVYIFATQTSLRETWKVIPLRKYCIFLGIVVVIAALSGLIIHQVGLGATIASLRYSVAGFVLFIIGFLLAWWFLDQDDLSLQQWYVKIIKKLLWFALAWYVIIFFIPRLLEFFGYNQYVYEGTVGEQPPAAYYNNYREGLPRNQFLFERPISWGFFLVAFWPLFFIFMMRYRPMHTILWRTGIYGVNILLTFSRAARIAWFVQSVIMFFLLFRHQLRRLILRIGIPALLVMGGVLFLARDQIIHRQYSNLGHIQHTLEAVNKVGMRPFWGEGPASAGPASHRPGHEGYNPENQYLQIWIEYGLRGFIAWMWLYIWSLRRGKKAYEELEEKRLSKKSVTHHYIIIAFAVGLLGLSLEGFFLHSFVDRMIVYPFMLLFGISFALYYKSGQHHVKPELE